MAYVYVHLREDTGEPFYVGMGKTPNRIWDLRHRNRFHKNVANKHGARGWGVGYNMPWEIAQWWEIRWIKALKAAGYDLVNLTDGGDSQPMDNPETRKKVSDAMKGRKLTEAVKEKLRKANLGKKYSEEHKAKLRGRKMSPQAHKKLVERVNTPEGRAACAKGRLGKAPYNKGTKMPEEQKVKLRARWVERKKRPVSNELREKGRRNAMKRWHPELVDG